jgi:glycosyl transferase, family 25
MSYFERGFVVNLPERLDRRRAVERELAGVGVRLQSASDGSLSGAPGEIELFRAVRPTEPGDFPSIGARGCFLSHLEILRTAQRRGLANVLVMEDDLALSPRFDQDAPHMLRALQQARWGVAYLGHVLPDPGGDAAFLLTDSTVELRTTHFYAINGWLFGRLIDHLESVLTRPAGHPAGGPMHVDGAYTMFRRQNPDVPTLVAQPTLGHQRASRSDICELRWFDRIPALRPMVSLARAVRAR